MWTPCIMIIEGRPTCRLITTSNKRAALGVIVTRLLIVRSWSSKGLWNEFSRLLFIGILVKNTALASLFEARWIWIVASHNLFPAYRKVITLKPSSRWMLQSATTFCRQSFNLFDINSTFLPDWILFSDKWICINFSEVSRPYSNVNFFWKTSSAVKKCFAILTVL